MSPSFPSGFRWIPIALLAVTPLACAPPLPEIVVLQDASTRDVGRVDASRLDARTDGGGGQDVAPGTDTGGGGGSDGGGGGGGGDTGPGPDIRCSGMHDSDADGLTNAEECTLGTDPYRADSDGDNVPDGVELRYPRICVAMDPARQRRPGVVCMTDSQCMAGERCTGISPTQADSDGDMVPDGEEDLDRDGMITPARGETDPRIADTDGDGTPDSMGGVEICRPRGLASVTQLGLPMAQVQVGHDPLWGSARRVPVSPNLSGVMMEDAATNVAGAVFNLRGMSPDLRAESARIELAITTALGSASAVLVGRSFRTHEMHEGITSTYRVARATNASALRDLAARALLGTMPTAGADVGTSAEFLVDIATVFRGSGAAAGTEDVVVTVAPRALYETNTNLTAIRAIDLVNMTGLALVDQGLGANCQLFRASSPPAADFLWTVDTSGSMSDDQERLGNTATRFFTRLRAAGVDFRVGVVTAGSAAPNLDSPGFAWISGSDPNGAGRLCQEVTTTACRTASPDSLRPYPMGGGTEEPTAAAILLHNEFRTRAMRGETNPNRRFREGARVVTFHVTDEPGTNDFSRYFQANAAPDTRMPWGAAYNPATLQNIVNYFRRHTILTFGLVPRSTTPCSAAAVVDLPRCVVEGNGGAVIPITTATDPEIDAAMTRIVESIAGATSQYVLDRTPITSTLKVRVRGMDVPRSRAEGFDYDGVFRALVFYGDRYRPRMGDEVVVSYRVWQPCPRSGATCASDLDCCAPTACREGRCQLACQPTGETCVQDVDCCAPNACISGRCAPRPMCVERGGACTPSETENTCCPPNVCVDGRCDLCRDPGAMCTRNTDCCGGSPCVAGRCACRPTSGRCTSPADCCSQYCVNGLCGPG
jgi:hypothetical protein